ncbi:PIN domain nuclease, partial [Candidatus Saccharibacteria bacterium]|nr:PIN domain nuclease [Candidatus Saccharibacteria bacterium]
MNLFLIIVLVAILLETTYIAVKASKKRLPSNNQKRKVYIDTSALMDGRILSVAQTGFIGDDLIIPRSVIRELQLLADGKDNEKRTRARFGMDVARELERVVYCNTTIIQDELNRTPVDERLISLAKENHGAICTIDFNLGKVAATEGIDVLNVNELAMTLRSEYLPGDKAKVKITALGSNPKQGVGHLMDGTMVVVD